MAVSCLILAAGMGSRLGDLTEDIPKALVSFLGKPLIEYQIKTLNSLGIERIAIATGYCSEKIDNLGYPTYFNQYFKDTNMVESLFSSMEFFSNIETDLLISYGDIIYQKKNLNAVLNCKNDVSVMVDEKWNELWSKRNESVIEDAETLKIDKDGYIVELGKKPKSIDSIDGQYTGLIFIKKNKIKDLIEFYKNMDREKIYDGKTFKNMFMTSFLQSLINFGWKIKATKVQNGWLEVDTIKDLEIYSKLYDDGVLSTLWNKHD